MQTIVTIVGLVLCVITLAVVTRASRRAYAEIMARAHAATALATTASGEFDPNRASHFSLMPSDYGTDRDPLVALEDALNVRERQHRRWSTKKFSAWLMQPRKVRSSRHRDSKDSTASNEPMDEEHAAHGTPKTTNLRTERKSLLQQATGRGLEHVLESMHRVHAEEVLRVMEQRLISHRTNHTDNSEDSMPKYSMTDSPKAGGQQEPVLATSPADTNSNTRSPALLEP